MSAAQLIPMGICNSEFAKWRDIFTPEESADEWMQNNVDLSDCHEWLLHMMPGIMFMTATPPQSFNV